MRILFLTEVYDPAVGSSTRQMYQEAARLRELGHETAVVGCTRNAAEASPVEIEGCLVFRIHSDYPVRWRAWVSLENKRITRPLDAILANWRPDVVHAHLVHTHIGYHALTQARNAGAGVVFTAHDVMTFCYQKLTCFHGGPEAGGKLKEYRAHLGKCIPCQRFRFRPGRNRAIKKVLEKDVHRFTVVSDELGEVIRANDIRVDKTVHNALRLQPEPPSAEAVSAFRAKHGLQDRLVLAIGGRLHEQKGVGQLLKMLALLRPEFPNLALIVMGKREIYDGEFAAQARDLGVADMVVPTGWIGGEELHCAYAATDVFVTPSICFDTFGLVNLEAMEHKKPVVATSFGGSQEVIEHGRSGFIENPFDEAAYAEAIARLLRDEDLRREMGEAGYLRLQKHFTIERLTGEYLAEYELAIAAAREGAKTLH